VALPDGADTIVIQENTSASADAVRILELPRKGANVRWRGDDFHEGDTVLAAGTRLTARHILLAASAGHAMLATVRKPVVAILATGDGDGQVAEDLAQKFEEARGADILVTTGGASVGDHDLVRPALEAWGAQLDFYKIAMRPGKPLFFGRNGAMKVLGLPGNPLASIIGARIFLVPLIARLLGRMDTITPISATLTAPIEANGPRTHYMRALLDTSGARARVTPFGGQDSSFVRALAQANCLAVIPADAPALPEGSLVNVLPLDF
jgi:molybdopterin molybdotransferase